MKCYDCGGVFVEKTSTLLFNDEIIGDYFVENITYSKCNKCGELLFSNHTLRVIEAKEVEILNDLIGRLPIDDFIDATETAQILDITRQAVHKHRRISKGFIFSKFFKGRRLFYKKSVELFRDTGDGRFSLYIQPKEPQVKYIIVASSSVIQKTYAEIEGETSLHTWLTNTNFLGQDYAQ